MLSQWQPGPEAHLYLPPLASLAEALGSEHGPDQLSYKLGHLVQPGRVWIHTPDTLARTATGALLVG